MPSPMVAPIPAPPQDGKPAAPEIKAEAVAPAPAAPAVNAPKAAAATAKAGTKADPAAGAADNSLPMIVYLGPLVLLFYLMILRPQQTQEKKRKLLLNALKKNDKVLTSAGMYGTIVSVDPAADKVVVRVDDDKGVKFTFSKASIVRVIDPPAEKSLDAATS